MLFHLEPDALYQTARLLLHEQAYLAEQIARLRLQVARLSLAWQGGEAEEFLQQVGALLTQLERQSREVEELAYLLIRQARIWEENDQTWAQRWRELLSGGKRP